MKLLLFGKIGSGKSYVGALLQKEFGLHYHDADDDLPSAIQSAIRAHLPISEAMREEFVTQIIARLAALEGRHPRFCVAQALFKNRHRLRIKLAVPDLHFIWVRSPDTLIRSRLEMRTNHIASRYYADRVNPEFEPPSLPHYVIDNLQDEAALRVSLAELLHTLESTAGPAGAPLTPP